MTNEKGQLIDRQLRTGELTSENMTQEQFGQLHAYRQELPEDPADRLAQYSRIATLLKEVIVKQKLFTQISGRDYVHVDGWVLLGNLCGLMPREVSVSEEGGNCFASVEIVRTTDGVCLGRASSMVGDDEATWAKRPRYARRSMAVTRATGKAFRLALSPVMSLAGFAVTPFEEMPTEEKPAPGKKPRKKRGPAPPVEIVEPDFNASFQPPEISFATLLDEINKADTKGAVESLGKALTQHEANGYLTRTQQEELTEVARARYKVLPK